MMDGSHPHWTDETVLFQSPLWPGWMMWHVGCSRGVQTLPLQQMHHSHLTLCCCHLMANVTPKNSPSCGNMCLQMGLKCAHLTWTERSWTCDHQNNRPSSPNDVFKVCDGGEGVWVGGRRERKRQKENEILGGKPDSWSSGQTAFSPGMHILHWK